MNELEIQLSPVQINKDNVTITISKEIAKYLGITKKIKELYIIPTNKLCQISVGQPKTVIPALTEFNMKFEKQDDLG